MMKNKHLLKNKNILGMTLIETIVSMWILGIVIVSMLSFVGATMSKRNQNKIQAIAVAKSELQDSEMTIKIEDQAHQAPPPHATILLFKSSYLVDSENNESKIEREDTFFTKYLIDSTSNDYQLSNASSNTSDKGTEKVINVNSNNTSDGINEGQSKDTGAKYIDSIVKSLNDSKEVDSETNGLDDVLDQFITPNETPVPNGPTIGEGGEKGLVTRPHFSYSEIEQLFKTSIDENIRYNNYKKIEEAYINYETKKFNGLNPGFKCFILLTNCDSKDIIKEGTVVGKKIKINVKTLYSAEKKNDGHYPLNIYEITSDLKLGTGIVN